MTGSVEAGMANEGEAVCRPECGGSLVDGAEVVDEDGPDEAWTGRCHHDAKVSIIYNEYKARGWEKVRKLERASPADRLPGLDAPT